MSNASIREFADQRSSVPSFTANGVEFECWVVDGGQRYEWRAMNGRLRAGRVTGNSDCWAAVDGHVLATTFAGLKYAMMAAVEVFEKEKAA